MPGLLQDKVALVTGAAAGIGRASALALAREGAKVVVGDVAVAGGEETVRRIQGAGGEAAFVAVDVSQAAAVEGLVARTMELYGRLDLAHNNAGIEGPRASVTDCTEEDWDRTLAVNLKGVWLALKFEIPAMLASGGGAIVNTASVYGLVGARKVAPYVASKHAIVGLTKSAALENVRKGIRINAVCPGLIDTEMIERAVGGLTADAAASRARRLLNPRRSIARAVLKSRQPAGRMGTPEEVAEAVVWLCSDRSGFVTGHALVLDGGMVVK